MLSVRPKTSQEIELNWSKTSCKRIAEHFCVAFIIRKKKEHTKNFIHSFKLYFLKSEMVSFYQNNKMKVIEEGALQLQYY